MTDHDVLVELMAEKLFWAENPYGYIGAYPGPAVSWLGSPGAREKYRRRILDAAVPEEIYTP